MSKLTNGFYTYQTRTSSIPRSQPGVISTFISFLPDREVVAPPVYNEDHHAAKPPRPPNVSRQFIFFKLINLKGTSQSELSKKIAEQWKNETPEMKKWFERDAEIKKLEHARLHPGYVFKPKRAAKSRSPTKSKTSSVSPKPRSPNQSLSTTPVQEFRSSPPHHPSQYVHHHQHKSQYPAEAYEGDGTFQMDDTRSSPSSDGLELPLPDARRPMESEMMRNGWDKENSQYSYQTAPFSSFAPPFEQYHQSQIFQQGYDVPRTFEYRQDAYEHNNNNGYEGYTVVGSPGSSSYQSSNGSSYGSRSNYSQPRSNQPYPAQVGVNCPEEYPSHYDYSFQPSQYPQNPRDVHPMHNYQFPVRY